MNSRGYAFRFLQGQQTFLFCKIFRPTLRPNLLPIRWWGGSSVIKNQSVKLTTYPISPHLHTPIRLHGVQNNKFKSTAANGEVQSPLFRIRFNVLPLESSTLSVKCGSEIDYYVHVFPNVQLKNHVYMGPKYSSF
jgi:hypothetical protein